MPHKTRLRPAHNKRYRENFEKRYGMSPAEYRKLKKTDPTKAHQKRLHAQR